LWQWSDGKLLKRLQANAAGSLTWIESVAISPDGQTLIAGVRDTIKLWDLRTGTLLRTLLVEQEALYPEMKRVTMTAVSPNGQVIAIGTASGTFQLWERHTGKLLRSVRAHNTSINALVFSANQKTLISGSNDGAIKFWLTDQLLSK
jgi:WD40 repeat protein